MSSVDEILATGRYKDRRERKWFKAALSGRWESPLRIDPEKGQTYLSISRDAMRLLIERDQHRDECLGLWECTDHPVPRVAVIESDYGSFARNSRVYDQHSTHSEDMDAARALAVGA